MVFLSIQWGCAGEAEGFVYTSALRAIGPQYSSQAAMKSSEAIDNDFLTRVVRRVVVYADWSEAEIRKSTIRALFIGGQLGSENLTDETGQPFGDLIRL